MTLTEHHWTKLIQRHINSYPDVWERFFILFCLSKRLRDNGFINKGLRCHWPSLMVPGSTDHIAEALLRTLSELTFLLVLYMTCTLSISWLSVYQSILHCSRQQCRGQHSTVHVMETDSRNMFIHRKIFHSFKPPPSSLWQHYAQHIKHQRQDPEGEAQGKYL